MVGVRHQNHLQSWLKRAVFLIVCLIIGPAQSATAQTIETTLDRINVQVGQPITVTAKVTGRVTGGLKLPDLPNYVVVRGPSQRSVTNIVNFQVKRYTEYTWSISGRRPGVFAFGPVVGQVDGKKAASAPYPFEVTIATTEGNKGSKPDVYVEASAEPAIAYPGQQVMYTLSIYRAVQVTNYRYAPPAFEGFLEEPMDESAQTERLTQVGGRQYVVKEVRHALFPTRPGELTIDPATVVAEVMTERKDRRRRGRFDPFNVLFDSPFGVRAEQRELTTNTVEVLVRQLPAGAPDDFYGLVGTFSLGWRLSERAPQKGASTTLTIDVEGTGNVRDIDTPSVSLDRFKVYEDAPTQQLSFNPKNQRLQGRKTFKLALIPLESGPQTLPPSRVSFFDPQSGRYRVATTPPMTLQVGPGDNKETENIAVSSPKQLAGQEVGTVGSDIMPPKTISSPRGEEIFGPGHPVAAALFLAPPISYLGLALVMGWRRRDAADPAGKKRRQALSNAKTVIETTRQTATQDPEEALRMLDRAVAGFVSDRLNLEGRTLTPVEAGQLVADGGASATSRNELEALLEAMVQAQYMPSASGGTSVLAMCDSADDLLKKLDREMS